MSEKGLGRVLEHRSVQGREVWKRPLVDVVVMGLWQRARPEKQLGGAVGERCR